MNCYENQIIISRANHSFTRKTVVFGKKLRHTINYNEDKYLLEKLNEAVNTLAVNAVHCDLHTLAKIQDTIIRNFPKSKFWYAKLFVIYDITIENAPPLHSSSNGHRGHSRTHFKSDSRI